jgi:predicted alpha/beta hydrolase
MGGVKILLASKIIIPLVAGLTKRFPVSMLGLGNDPAPSRYFKQWAQWLSRPDYLLDADFGLDRMAYRKLHQPGLFFSFDDDELAPAENVDHLMAFYTHMKKTHRKIDPHDWGVTHIGHTGYFRSHQKAQLWKSTCAWLDAEQ